jgi:hypothetical protein
MNKRSVKKQAAKTSRSSVARKPSSARKTVGKSVVNGVAKTLGETVGKSVGKTVADTIARKTDARRAPKPEAIPAAAITMPSPVHRVAARTVLFHAHKFRVGQTVLFTSSPITRPGASGTYKVVSLLPSDGDDYQYRIKNSGEAFERVAKESQLENEH